jgi:hypothetical protein
MDRLFSTTMLAGIIFSLIRPPSFLLKNFFGGVAQFPSQEVAFDIEKKTRRVPFFVIPTDKGIPVSEAMFATNKYTAGYVKENTTFDPNRALMRAMGERIGGGEMSAMERRMLQVAITMRERQEAIIRGKEVQAMQGVTTGLATISGPGMPTSIVDFQRDPLLTIHASGTSLWSNALSTPLKDVQSWIGLVFKSEAAIITDVVFDPDAWNAFYNNPEVQAAFEVRNYNPGSGEGLPIGPSIQDTDAGCVLYKGMIGTLRYWVYNDFYLDASDVTQPILPSGTVIGVSTIGQGVGKQLHGAIMDEEASLAPIPVEMYAKSWYVQDEGKRIIQTAASFLVALTRPNATFCANVL